MLTRLYSAEPILITVVGSALFWPALFQLLSAFGHPLSHDQQDAISGFAVLLGTLIARSQVTPVNKVINPKD
jgi:hypothetical protein